MFDFITPARTKILLVPVNDCTPSQFEQYYGEIKTNVSEIRLLDITIDDKLQYFNPKSSPNGRIFPEFITTGLDESIFLHDFEPYRKVFVVIGIGPYKSGNSDNVSQLQKIYTSAIVHNEILFDSPKDVNDNECTFHHHCSSPITALETIFCDISRNFLISLDNYALSYGNITLRSPVSITDSNVLSKTITHAQKRLSSGSTSFKASFETEMKQNHLKYLGRQKKLMGNFYLLSGKYHDAFQCFVDSLTNLKKSDDFLWLANALEGLAISVLLLSFIGQTFQIPTQINSILHLSKTEARKPDSATSSPRNSLTGFSYSIDLNTVSTPELVKNINLKVMHFYDLSTNDYENMVPDIVYIECILRKIKLMIGFHYSNTIEQIVLNQLHYQKINPNFPTREILEEIDRIFKLQLIDLPLHDQCRIYSSLANMYDDLKLYRKKGFILRILLVCLLPKLFLIKHSIHDILESLYKLYGINKEPEANIEDSTGHNWVSLQIQLLKLSLKIAENLNDQQLLSKLCTLLLTRYTHCLPVDDQVKLKEKIGTTSCTYWDPFLLRDVQLVNKKDDLISFHEYETKPSVHEPFFDPYKKKNQSQKSKLVIKDDVYQLKITLQNPFGFEIEIIDIGLEGVETIRNLASAPLNGKVRKKVVNNTNQASSLTVSPMSCEQFFISFRPSTIGELRISGLNITVGNCKEQFFYITDQEVSLNDNKLSKKIDNTTLDQVVENLKLKNNSRVTTKELILTVIPPQPLLVLSELSVSNSWLMLLEGEKFQFSVKLLNTSDVIINYLSYSFWDSTTEYINKKLLQQLNASEVYDLEHDLIKFKPFKILTKDIGEKIQPNQTIEIQYEMTSRKMMKEVRIILDYANKSSDNVFVKQLSIPLNISIMPSIEIVGCDILNIQLPDIQIGERQCLLILDLRNCWTEKLNCKLKYKSREFTNSIESNLTRRFIIPIDKIDPTEHDLTQAIPSLVNKQFIKNYNLTEQEEISMKELFWLRYYLLKELSGKWFTKSRKGLVDLRNVRINNKMSNNLMINEIQVINEINGQKKCHLELDEFYNLQTTVINNSSNPISGFIRHIPLSLIGNTRHLPIDKKILINGILQNKLTVPPKSKTNLSTNFAIIEKGEYEWGTVLDLLNEKMVNKETLYIQA